MSRCKYCGEHAGFLTKYHSKCHEVKSSAWQNLLIEIESWYNRRRRHSALGYKTIEELEINNYKFKTAA